MHYVAKQKQDKVWLSDPNPRTYQTERRKEEHKSSLGFEYDENDASVFSTSIVVRVQRTKRTRGKKGRMENNETNRMRKSEIQLQEWKGCNRWRFPLRLGRAGDGN